MTNEQQERQTPENKVKEYIARAFKTIKEDYDSEKYHPTLEATLTVG